MNTTKVLGSVGGVVGAGLLFYATCFQYVEPWKEGVRKVKISPLGMLGETGWQKTKYPGGRVYFVPPVLTEMAEVDTDWQTFNYDAGSNNKGRDHSYTTDFPAARIETSDQYAVDVDISQISRVTDPFKIVTNNGQGDLYKTAIMAPNTVDSFKTLGGLKPEDFFQLDENRVPKRIAAEKRARDSLQRKLDNYGIETHDILVRFPQFNEAVQRNFEAKSVQDQLQWANKAEAALAEKNAELGKLVAMGEQAKAVRIKEGEGYASRVQGQIDAYTRQRESAGDRLELMAEAEKKRLVNDAYQGDGSDLLVALQMAKNLGNLDQILIPVCNKDSFNPLNLEKTTRELSGSQK